MGWGSAHSISLAATRPYNTNYHRRRGIRCVSVCVERGNKCVVVRGNRCVGGVETGNRCVVVRVFYRDRIGVFILSKRGPH